MTASFATAPALLHVGYPKTASTYLQQAIFNNPDFGLALPGGPASRGYLVDWFRASDGYRFDPGAVAEEMAALEAPVRAQGLRPVWSDETLLGNPITRTYDGAWILDKIARLERPMKVLITIRRQPDLILSAYREYLKLHRHSLTDFIGTGDEPRSYRPILHEEYLQFDIAARQWGQAFGHDNLLVLPQELLRADPAGFIARLADFLGVAAPPVLDDQARNVGLGGTALLASRPLNGLFLRSPLSQRRNGAERVVRKMLQLINRLAPAALDRRIDQSMRARIAARFDGTYAASNRRLSELTNLDLAALGYPV